MKSRITFIFITLNLLLLLVLLRAASLQIIPNERLSSLHKKQFETLIELHGRRGDISDRKGHELAVSVPAYSLFADPKVLSYSKSVIPVLSQELGIPKKTLKEKFQNKSRFVWISRRLEREKRDQLQRFIDKKKIKGLGFIEESIRIYPNDKLLSNTIGFVGIDGKGLEGIELEYNDILSGQNKKVSMQKDARGRPLMVNGQLFHETPDGADIQLTIDRDLQFILEQELNQVVTHQSAESAVGVILDANTSEVLAMATVPSFNANQADKSSPENRRNRVITDSFEPGSTMKSILIASALQKKAIQTQSRIDCEGGEFKVGDKIIHESDAKHNFHWLNIGEILAYSSNVGAAKIGLGFGAENYRNGLDQFGFGQKTNIDLPGEVRGLVQNESWRSHLLANISFGHGIGVTALQIANAYAAIANGGWLRRPYIVKKIQDNESREITETQVKTLRRVLTQDVSDKMKMLLVGATDKEATGFQARVPGFLVAGKTGTAQKVNPNGKGYLKGAYIASFAGFIPANDPKFVIYIAVDHPKKEFYGGQVAAPVFSRVAQFAVRQFGLAPVYASDSTFISEKKLSALSPEKFNKVVAEEVQKSKIESKSLEPKNVVENKVNTENKTENKVNPTLETSLETAQENLKDFSKDPNQEAKAELVPDLIGLSLREVLSRISNTDIDVKLTGSGFVQVTNPKPGTIWPNSKDKKLEVRLGALKEYEKEAAEEGPSVQAH